MKRWCALALAVMLVLSLLCGCASADEKKIRGKWKCDVDLAAAYEDLLARSDASVAAHIDLTDFNVTLTVTFKDDGTYAFRVDEEELASGAEKMAQAIRAGLASYLQAQTGKTMENLLSATGMTYDEIMNRYFTTDLADTIAQNLQPEGTYKINGGKLVLLDEEGNKVFEGKYAVDGDSLELKSGVTSNLFASLLPLKLKKK